MGEEAVPQEMPAFSGAPLDERVAKLFRYAQIGQCVNGVTHDINNVLGAIMAYAELVLLDDHLNDESRRMLESVVEGISKCSDLITGLTAIARKDKDSESMIDPVKLFNEVLALSAYTIRAEQIKLETDIPKTAPSIIGDAPKLKHALLSLLNNAREACAEEQQKLVRLRLQIEEAGVRFLVWNTGPVLESKTLEQLFLPYQTRHTEGPHLGFGLYTARRNIEKQGGRIDYLPEKGFSLWMPLPQG